MKKILLIRNLLLLTIFSTIIIKCSPPSGGSGSSGSSHSSHIIGVNELILIVLVILIFAFWKGRKNPKLAAFIFLGLGLISLIIGFKFKDWIWQNVNKWSEEESAQETVKTSEPIIFLLAFLFLIIGGYYLYKSTSKKS